MPRIRHLYARNFRALKELSWYPTSGINCLIGAGDTGKSTILDAIDIILNARHSYQFTDADFYRLDTSLPIEIYVTVGDLPDDLKNIETYGNFLRGFNTETLELYDEPNSNNELVLTIRLIVTEDLEPDWLLYSERAYNEGLERRIAWKHRQLVYSARLGATSHYHFSWSNRSILNKLSEEPLNVSSTFADISRQTRTAFASYNPPDVDDVLKKVKETADSLGVTLNKPHVQLDVRGVSLSAGAISLHDEDNTPLRQLGTGSSRLLISGLHMAASTSDMILIDEAEYGLEPFRISRLLNKLGSKSDSPDKQVFISTHSPYVIRELKSTQLSVVRPNSDGQSHTVVCLGEGNDKQATLRACAEAFLSKRIIVCEGKTEIGLIRGIDLKYQEINTESMYSKGTYCADGGGDNLFNRAMVFKELGYSVVIFKDSDKPQDHMVPSQNVQNAGINIYEWGNGNAFEDVLFTHCPEEYMPSLLSIAIDRMGDDSVNDSIQSYSNNQYGISECTSNFNDSMRPVLAQAAKKRGWYKDIDPAERVGKEIIAPIYSNLHADIKSILDPIITFAYSE